MKRKTKKITRSKLVGLAIFNLIPGLRKKEIIKEIATAFIIFALVIVLVVILFACAIPGKINPNTGGDYSTAITGNLVIEFSFFPIPLYVKVEGKAVITMEGEPVGTLYADGIILQVGDTICTLEITDISERGVFGTLACEGIIGSVSKALFVIRPPLNVQVNNIFEWVKKIWPDLKGLIK